MKRATRIVSLHTDQNDVPSFEFIVGWNGVDKIEHEVENYGDHGIAWFNVYEGYDLAHSVAAKAVAYVEWAREEEAKEKADV